MPDRKTFLSMLWLTSSLAPVLVASVLVAPIRTSGFASVLPGKFSVSPGQPATDLSAAMDTGAVPEVGALPSENEEQGRANALDEPRVPFLIPCSFCKVPDRQSTVPRSIRSLYPLRC